jgi:hypothetical protein
MFSAVPSASIDLIGDIEQAIRILGNDRKVPDVRSQSKSIVRTGRPWALLTTSHPDGRSRLHSYSCQMLRDGCARVLNHFGGLCQERCRRPHSHRDVFDWKSPERGEWYERGSVGSFSVGRKHRAVVRERRGCRAAWRGDPNHEEADLKPQGLPRSRHRVQKAGGEVVAESPKRFSTLRPCNHFRRPFQACENRTLGVVLSALRRHFGPIMGRLSEVIKPQPARSAVAIRDRSATPVELRQ